MDEHLQGRIIALELFMRSELVAISMSQKDPVSHLLALKTALLADFHTFGPVDAYSQSVLNEVRSTLEARPGARWPSPQGHEATVDAVGEAGPDRPCEAFARRGRLAPCFVTGFPGGMTRKFRDRA